VQIITKQPKVDKTRELFSELGTDLNKIKQKN
jgi:hypothetical protein